MKANVRPRAKAPFWLLGVIALFAIGILVEGFILATTIDGDRRASAAALIAGASPTPNPRTPPPPPLPSPTPTSSPTPTPSATSSQAQLHGRVVLNGSPADARTVVVLEDAAYLTIATQPLDSGGRFTFGELAPLAG